MLDDERAPAAVGFLRRAIAHFAAFGIRVERLMTDNGNAYRSAIHALACQALGIKHLRIRPYRPRTNGKAERFIRTMLGGWAYGAVYRTKRRTTPRAPRLARLLQSTTTTPQPRPPSPARALTRAQPEQRPRVKHPARVAIFDLIGKVGRCVGRIVSPCGHPLGSRTGLLRCFCRISFELIAKVGHRGGCRLFRCRRHSVDSLAGLVGDGLTP